MPLPANNTAWPPAELATILPKLSEYDAWFTGDHEALGTAYGSAASNRPSQRAGGIVGAVSRWFWGNPTPDDPKYHAPLAADVCRVNADLLFGDPITASIKEETSENDEANPLAQERLDLITDSMHQLLPGAGEVSSALGGVYLRATWDASVSDSAFITKVDADMAWPEFRWGRLTAVTFWRTIHTDNQTVWRHLERHELRGTVGVVVHGLYEGTGAHVGTRREFEARPETVWLTTQALIDGDTISTQTPGLDVVYVPNLEQAKLWRKHPLGANLGRSDLEGLLTDFDAYDKAYTSLMRDLEDGASKLLVSDNALQDLGPGKGAGFDVNQRLFTGLTLPPGKSDGAKMPVEQVQFKIRVEEHLAIMASILDRVIRSAGYSPRSFGLNDSDVTKTATEVVSEDGLSAQTRKRKIRIWSPALETILTKALAIDSVVLRGGSRPLPVEVAFAEASHESPEALARIVQTLRNAQAASTRTLVRIYNPSWDEEAVDEETALVIAENGLTAMSDPDERPPGAELTPEFGE